MNETQAIQMLHNKPLDFLREHSVVPYSAADRQALICTLHMINTSTPIKRPGKRHIACADDQVSCFKVRTNSLQGGQPFQAIYLPVQPSNIAINPFTPDDTGINLVIAAQSSGCCIVMVPFAGSDALACLQPHGESEQDLLNRLARAGIKVFRPPDCPAAHGVIIGVRHDADWHFYVQRLDARFNVIDAEALS